MLTRADRIALCLASFAGIWALLSAVSYLSAVQSVSAALRRVMEVL